MVDKVAITSSSISSTSSCSSGDYGQFTILWRGAMDSLITQLETAKDIKGCSKNSKEEEKLSEFDEYLSQFLDSLDDSDQTPELAEESPLKPVKRKRRQAPVIDSDSDSDNDSFTRNKSRSCYHDNKINESLLDSDSDLEILCEDWRSPTLVPVSSVADIEPSSDDNETQDNSSPEVQSPIIFKLTNKRQRTSDSFKVPKLPPIKPFKRPLRSNNKPNTRHRSSTSNNVKEKSISSRSRRLPVAIEEEIIGEFQYSSGEEDEDYVQKARNPLIENEAQCSDEESHEESDGEYEQSFIHDSTILSQQCSQESMHAVYLQSLHDF